MLKSSVTAANVGHINDLSRRLTRAASDSTILRVSVGKKPRREFFVHEKLLSSVSPYFENMFGGKGWKEANEHHVILGDEDPEIFNAYVGWLYSGRIFRLGGGGKKELNNLIEFYIMGDKFQHVELKDAVIDRITSLVNENRIRDKSNVLLPDPENVYQHTSEGSSLRRLTVDLWYFHHSLATFRPVMENDELDEDFSNDLLFKIWGELEKSKIKKPWLRMTDQPCLYHEHKHGECYKNHSV